MSDAATRDSLADTYATGKYGARAAWYYAVEDFCTGWDAAHGGVNRDKAARQHADAKYAWEEDRHQAIADFRAGWDARARPHEPRDEEDSDGNDDDR